jgi:hypothetical protein
MDQAEDCPPERLSLVGRQAARAVIGRNLYGMHERFPRESLDLGQQAEE